MRRIALVPTPPASDSIIEEVAVLQIEMLTVDIHIKKLEAKRKWLALLHDNFMKRFGDYC